MKPNKFITVRMIIHLIITTFKIQLIPSVTAMTLYTTLQARLLLKLFKPIRAMIDNKKHRTYKKIDMTDWYRLIRFIITRKEQELFLKLKMIMDSHKCITHLASMAVTSSIRFSSHSSNKPTTMESWRLSLLTICNQDRAVSGLRISICRNCRTKRADNTLSKIKLERIVKLFS